MAKIVNLNELLPEDIMFLYGEPEVEYVVPGDLDVEQVFRLYDMFHDVRDEMAKRDTGDLSDEAAEATQRAIQKMRGELLRLFQIRQPELKELPFGIRGTAVVISHILRSLNPPDEEEEDKEKLPPTSRNSSTRTRSPKTTAAKRPRSRGSRRS